MTYKFNVGDKVRYTGTTRELVGAEGTVTSTSDHVTAVEVTKATQHYHVGETCYPDTDNLEPLKGAPEMVEHPDHYGGKDNPYEVIKVAEAWGLDKDAYLFNVLKYIARAGKKDDLLQELRKGHFYLGRRISVIVKERAAAK